MDKKVKLILIFVWYLFCSIVLLWTALNPNEAWYPLFYGETPLGMVIFSWVVFSLNVILVILYGSNIIVYYYKRRYYTKLLEKKLKECGWLDDDGNSSDK